MKGVAGLCLIAAMVSTGLGQTAFWTKLQVKVDKDGSYAISSGAATPVQLKAGVAAEINGRWIHAADYPHIEVKQSASDGPFGSATEWHVRCYGLADHPDLAYRLRAYDGQPFADLQVTVQNNTGSEIKVQGIRAVEVSGAAGLGFGSPAQDVRVLSDSFSEDRPAMKIHELGDPLHGMHRAVGSQLLYDRGTHQSVFLGALASEKFLTILRLHVDGEGGRARVAGV